MKPDSAFARSGFVDPIRITAILWLFVLTGAGSADLNPLSPVYLAFLVIGIGAHLCGMAARRLQQNRTGRVQAPRKGFASTVARATARLSFRRANRITLCLLALQIAGILFFLSAYSEVAPSIDAAGFLAARNAYLDEVRGVRDKLFLYTTHLTLFGIGALFFAARAYRDVTAHGLRASKVFMNLVAVSTFLVALLTTGRTAPLLVILSYSFYCLRFRIFGVRTVISLFAVISLLMFILVALALGKEGLGDSDQVGAVEAMMNLARLYFFSAPIAMQEVVMKNEVVSNACSNILSYPIDLLKKVGLFSHCDVRELDFVFVPVATNVFTFFRAYWEDFGLAYPAAMFASGYLIESVHVRAFQKSAYCAFIFPFVLNGVLLQIFEEQLFANGSVFAYLTASYLVCALIYRGPGARTRERLASHVPGPAAAA
jgi:oligosaccharide repeat unit polymerase